MYSSFRNDGITANPRKTTGKHVDEFIRDTCSFYYGSDTITEIAYEKYVKYCQDRNLDFSTFNGFARAFRYLLIHERVITGIGVHPVNYLHYKNGFGYVSKAGWAYNNLVINY